MVEDTVTDGKRIAQLLASELTGLEAGILERVAVTDADTDATPSESGTVAYRVTVDETEIAAVELYPEYVQLQFSRPVASEVAPELCADEPTVATVTSGVEVKRAVDLLRETAQR
jgi:hypothetical protein